MGNLLGSGIGFDGCIAVVFDYDLSDKRLKGMTSLARLEREQASSDREGLSDYRRIECF